MNPSTRSALKDPFGLAGSLLEGQYRVDTVVGEGGFGVVYRGRHLSLDQPIAVKALKGLDDEDPRVNALVLEKFRAEARLLYTLSQTSLHIVRSLDFGATTTPAGIWAPFMILEWLEGRSLADDIADRRRRGLQGRSIAEALAILEPAVDGLVAAHRQNVAHRDVKPANIFLLAQNVPGRTVPPVKVLDFGIAKIMKEGEAAGTKGTFASFTWLYASPEQLEPSLGATGLATDVYALALVLTELLTDRPPVEERDVVAIMRAATDPDHRPTPRARGANVPDELEAVCQRALAVHPKDRFGSIAELWDALGPAMREASRNATVMHAPVSRGTLPTRQVTAPTMVVPMPDTPAGTAVSPPMSVLGPTNSPPPGTRPPGLATPPPMMSPHGRFTPVPLASSPPRGTSPPGVYAAPPSYGASPPPGTRPPGGAHFARSSGVGPLGIVAIIFVVLATLFMGSCALLYGAVRWAQ
ncbi:MAG TPA: protein kinase [Labilithrix sp.]|nr:protein kinase [Labilithrix sp.]